MWTENLGHALRVDVPANLARDLSRVIEAGLKSKAYRTGPNNRAEIEQLSASLTATAAVFESSFQKAVHDAFEKPNP